jgi:hypothetical protein
MDGGFAYSQEAPFVYIVKDKATKTYETQGAPVDLASSSLRPSFGNQAGDTRSDPKAFSPTENARE